MSLILEALKKSEQQRRLGEAPTLGSPVVATRRRRSLLPVFAVLIVVAAAAGWWLTRPAPPPASQPAASDSAKPIAAQPANRPANPAAKTPNPARGVAAPIAGPKDRVKPGTVLGEQNRTRADNKADIEKRAAASAMQPATAPSKTTAATLPKPTTPTPAGTKPLAAAPALPKPADAGKTPAPTADTGAAAAAAAKTAPRDADRIATDKIATDPDTIATRAPAAPPPAPAAAGAQQIPSIWELPYATRKDIPAIDLTMHVYSSDPAQRFAVVKGVRHGEGDEIGEDLVLREIRPDGLVLEYKGQRFLFPRNGR